MTWASDLHLCWFIEAWSPSREKYLRAWQQLGWHCVLWHSGQIEEAPVPGVELRLVDDLIAGSEIEEVFKYERHYGSHASCADIFRYFVLYKLGGAYVDIDVLPDRKGEVAPGLVVDHPLFAIPEAGPGPMVLAMEIRFIRSPAGHELLQRLVSQALKNEKRYKEKGGYAALRGESILHRTGPVMAQEVVRKYAKEKTELFDSFLIRGTLDNTPENRGPGFAVGVVRATKIAFSTKRKNTERHKSHMKVFYMDRKKKTPPGVA
jgi:hypothetical protein